MNPSWNSAQLMTLKVGSNIHFQAKVDSTVGMMKGSRMKARTSALPLKWRLSSIASHRPSASLNTVVTPVYQNVFQTVVRKMLSFQILTKFFSPTNSPGTPTRWLVSDSNTPSMKGYAMNRPSSSAVGNSSAMASQRSSSRRRSREAGRLASTPETAVTAMAHPSLGTMRGDPDQP